MMMRGVCLVLASLISVILGQEETVDDVVLQTIINVGADHFVSTEPVPFAAAENACLQAGGLLAGLEAKSAFDMVSHLFEKSAAPATSQGYWMKSHAEGEYEPSCIALMAGEKSGMPANCADLHPVICEKAIVGGGGKRKGGKKEPRRRVIRKPCADCPDRFNCNLCDYKSKSSSSSSSSSSSTESGCTCADEGCVRDYINDMDFYTNVPILSGAGSTWSYYQDANIIADGGLFSTSCRGGVLDTKVYTTAPAAQTNSPYSDRYKYFISANEQVAVPKGGNLAFEFLASVRTLKTEQNPFPDVLTSRAGDDVRFASGLFQVFESFDAATPKPNSDGLAFSFYLTNDRIYAGYERRAQIDDATGAVTSTYAAFAFLVPVKVRRQCDFHSMKIVFNQSNRYVSWRLDGREVFRVSKIGYLLNREFMLTDFGGAESDAFPEVLQYGFGSATWVDAYPACLRSDTCRSCKFPDLRQALVQTVTSPAYYVNPVLGGSQPAVFWNPSGDLQFRLWGQGSETSIKRLAVYTENCGGNYF